MAQVRISDPAIGEAYRRITASDPDIDYMLLSYVGQTNDLKIQEQGSGGLAELEDSWNDGRIQFAFVRVKDPGSGLSKFVLIAWCGDGVLESRKGLFHSHASTVAQFLKGYHVQINARCDTDVDPARIMKKVADSSGAKYSIHNEKPVKREMPAPVGTNYKPIGRPDIAAMTSKHKPTPPAPVGTSYTSMKNELAEIRATRTAPSAAPVAARAPVGPTMNDQEFEPTIKATLPPPIIAPRPTISQSTAPVQISHDVEKEERPGYVGTAYTPVSLGKPGKLGSRLSAFSAPQELNHPVSAANNSKKMTWAERQALAKRVAAEEEAQSRAAIERSTVSMKQLPTPTPTPPFPPAPPAPASENDFDTPLPRGIGPDERWAPEDAIPPTPPSQPTLPTEPILETSHPPPPPPPPAPPAPPPIFQMPSATATHKHEVDPVEDVARAETLLQEKMDSLALAREPTATDSPEQNLRAVAIYDYQQADTDEMSFSEGEIIINIQQIDEGWWTGMSSDGSRQGLFPATCVNLISDKIEDAPEIAPEAEEDRGIVATAMYDYEAGEDNEITFEEGEEIFEIEYSSEDWWTGTVASSGQRGLFPANYVELKQ